MTNTIKPEAVKATMNYIERVAAKHGIELPKPKPHRCDCEHTISEDACGHVAGGCNHEATITVRHYGLRAGLCQGCFDATCNPTIYPLQEKLRAEFEVML